MSRITPCFAALKKTKRTALIPFITAGDPHPKHTVELMHAMATAGADILELGVPFSDPMAEGPVIQKACERALVHNVSLKDVIELVKEFRQTNNSTPVILMGYFNPFEAMGYSAFAKAAQKAGIDGVLTVDLPPEEGKEFSELLAEHDIDPIFLLSPTSAEDRIKTICAVSKGFTYYVSLKGVTGAANLDMASIKQQLAQIRKHSSLPVAVGFGIKDAATAAQVGTLADGVVVGSALVRIIEENIGMEEAILPRMKEKLASIRQALDN